MPPIICTTDMPETLSEFLRRANDDHEFTPKAARRITRLPQSRIQRMFAGVYDFIPAAIAEMLSKSPLAVADDLVCNLLRGTPYTASRVDPVAEKETTPVAGAIDVQRSALELLELAHEAMLDGRVDEAEKAKVVSKLNQLRRAADNVAASVRNENSKPRRNGRSS